MLSLPLVLVLSLLLALVSSAIPWLALLLAPLVPLVGWARWQLRAHTVAQAVAATMLAIVITLGTFWLFGVA